MEEIEIQNEISQTKRKVFYFIMTVFLVVTFSIVYVIYRTNFSMAHLPTGEKLFASKSPVGTYTLNIYRTNGGATTSYAIRGELRFNKQKGKVKNIYWEYKNDTAKVEWLDDNRVRINGHILHLPNEKYDYRHS